MPTSKPGLFAAIRAELEKFQLRRKINQAKARIHLLDDEEIDAYLQMTLREVERNAAIRAARAAEIRLALIEMVSEKS